MKQEQVSLLIEENLKTIYAYSLSRVSNKEDAEDLAGDIVLAIFGSAPKMRDENAFFGYIWAIAGISMEREFGERSYNPFVFEFITVFSEQFNRKYRNLFNCKLPGIFLLVHITRQ